MSWHCGPNVVNDSLIFCFDAGNIKCTDADDAVASMRDIAPVAHSSRSDRGITGTGNTGNFSFPTDTGASKVIDLSISTNSNSDADGDNRLALDDDINFADEEAWSFEWWGKLNSSAQTTAHSMAGHGAGDQWFLVDKVSGSNNWVSGFREDDATYRLSATQTSDVHAWHQVVITVTTGRVMKFYIDGAAVNYSDGSASVTITDTGTIINRIMAGYVSSSGKRYGWQGVLLCCRIYSKDLSAAEVKQNFDATRRRVGL